MAIWAGKHVKGSYFLEGLDEMMQFYCIKPYHITLLHYLGGGDFSVSIYTPYVIEMEYPMKRSSYPSDLVFNSVEIDKLSCTFHFNVCRNFVGLYDLLLEKEHFVVKASIKVLSDFACSELGLSESVKWMTLGFEKHQWRIQMKWVNGEVFFGKQCFRFLEPAKVVDGDILSFGKTAIPTTFKVAVLERETSVKEELSEDIPMYI